MNPVVLKYQKEYAVEIWHLWLPKEHREASYSCHYPLQDFSYSLPRTIFYRRGSKRYHLSSDVLYIPCILRLNLSNPKQTLKTFHTLLMLC